MSRAAWFAIVNETAGGGRCGKRSVASLAALRESGLELEVRRTERAGHATDLAREAWAQGFHRFLCVGGDGTSFEVLNGLFPLDGGGQRPTLASLPMGTGNSFLRDFGVTGEAEALERIKAGRTRAVDVVRAEHARGTLHYLNIFSLGFSATVGDLTNRRYKGLGAAGYAMAVLTGLVALRRPSYPLRVDGGELDSRSCALLSFCNSRFTGGTMMMAPEADAGDGQLDVIRVGPMGRLALLRAFHRIYAGTHVALAGVEASRATRVQFEEGPEVPVMVDGEVMPLSLRSLAVVPGAIEVVA